MVTVAATLGSVFLASFAAAARFAGFAGFASFAASNAARLLARWWADGAEGPNR